MPKTFQITEDYRFAAGEEEEVKLQSKDPNVVALMEAKKEIAALKDQLAAAGGATPVQAQAPV